MHFVFDEPLLTSLRLDGKRLVFLADSLADLSTRRELTVWRGRPIDLLSDRHEAVATRTFAVTHAPVPGFTQIAAQLERPLSLEPWRWLRPPTPSLMERLNGKRFLSFKDWCRITKPSEKPIE